jgi:hypothetical protein
MGACSYDYDHSVMETREWPASEVSAIQVTTQNGHIAVVVADSDPIIADIERTIKAKNASDAEDNIDRVVVTDTIRDGVLVLDAEAPDDNPYVFGARFDIETSAVESLDLVTTNGGLDVTGLRGDVLGVTTNGGVNVTMTAIPHDGVVDLGSTNGGITLVVPANTSATFDATTTNGGVDVLGFPDVTFDTDDSTHKAGTLGAGEATIILRTSNGGIDIVAGG